MKVGDAAKYIRKELEHRIDNGEIIPLTQIILEDLTGFEPSELSIHKDENLPAAAEEKLYLYLQRLRVHEPIQYIIGKAWFYGLPLYVDNNVLIPRPETEELVDWIIGDVEAKGLAVFNRDDMQADATKKLKILDIGTGSGCIALGLKKTMPLAEVWGCDSSEEALNVARRNGALLDIRVDFQGVNFLDEAQQRFLPTVDIIVSNPPYIPEKDKDSMQPNVLNFEPHTALFVPDDDALLFYRAIAKFAKKRLYENGSIYLEIHEDLGEAVVDLFKAEGYQHVECRKDMQGKNRMVKV